TLTWTLVQFPPYLHLPHPRHRLRRRRCRFLGLVAPHGTVFNHLVGTLNPSPPSRRCPRSPVFLVASASSIPRSVAHYAHQEFYAISEVVGAARPDRP
uniref:Uncharacterized protein n=1 Tax=Triticum urartu TaxID=4572 RepID=A0A8R7UUU2_TRIUA